MISFGNFALILIIIIVLHGAEAQRYGVDVSFPMQHETVSSNYDHLPHNQAPASHPTVMKYHEMPIQPLGDRQKEYSKFIKGCVDTFNATSCGEFEEGRIEMNLRQPASMVNYTKTGFHKTRTTDGLWQLIQGFWERNKDKQEKEVWPAGNTFVNHWSAPSYLVRIIEDKALRGEGPRLAKAIWDETKKSMQDWTGQELEDCSMYGIRIYTEGSILNPHVDRLPLVMSAVINVAQDVDEEWPMEFIGHDGKALNITMKPGDMILYESHSVLHGRPFPLKGKHFANIFVHFEPTGHSMKYHDYDASMSKGVKGIGKYSVNKEIGGHEIEGHRVLPPYIIPDSLEDKIYREEHPDTYYYGINNHRSSPAHIYAGQGKTSELVDLLEDQLHLVHSRDRNGWLPLHEASRSGHLEAAKYLVEKGANINGRFGEKGGTALFLAGQYHGKNSEIYKYLASVGGVWEEPEL